MLVTARRALTVLLAEFLHAQIPPLRSQLTGYMIPTGPSAHVLAGVDHLRLDWQHLIPQVTPLLVRVAQDGARQALRQVRRARVRKALSPDSITQLANGRAEDWAEARAAELVGMKRIAGQLLPNPNPTWTITESTREAIRELVEEAIQEGWSNDTLAERLEVSETFSHTRAEMIARTETAKADVQGNLAGYKSWGVEMKESLLSELHDDADTCDCAENAEAGPIPIDDDFPSGDDGPPYHPHCFIGTTRVAACGITAHMTRWFEGDVVVLRLGGTDLTVTPNHPILTPHGWIAAGALPLGETVFHCSNPGRAVELTDPHDYHVPTPIEQIARTLRRTRGMRTAQVPTSSEHFHGDGMAHGEVEMVWPHRTVTGHDPNGVAVPHSLTVRRRTDPQTSPLEQLAERGAVTVDALCQLYRGLAGLIEARQVTEIRTRDFSGPVYNLSTTDGWYFAEGILTSNCVCDVLPVLAEEQEDGREEAPEE